MSSAVNEFVELLTQALQSEQFVKLHLQPGKNPPHADWQTTTKQTWSITIVKNTLHIQRKWHTATQEQCHNSLPSQAIDLLAEYFALGCISNATLLTTLAQTQLKLNKKNTWWLHTSSLAKPISNHIQPHNTHKNYLLNLQAPYLADLGITHNQHKLVPAMAHKWKQMNKFVELCAHAIGECKAFEVGQPLSIADFGSGKGYLTFALHDYLQQQGYQASVTGVELRANLVELCNQVASKHGYQQLIFAQGDVADYTPAKLDMMIALHACDTATDMAIYMGIRLAAPIIMVAPCCHKELRPQLQSPSILQGILSHGIHQSQQCDMLTDSMRALLMQAHGYRSKVIEFISSEHTSKNKMIIGILDAKVDRNQAAAEYQQLKSLFGIHKQTLEQLLVVTAHSTNP